MMAINDGDASAMTLHLPADLEAALADAASRRGVAPEALALAGLRQLFPAQTEAAGGATLLDFLAGYVGVVDGTTEPLSRDCGHHFATGLADERNRRDLD